MLDLHTSAYQDPPRSSGLGISVLDYNLVMNSHIFIQNIVRNKNFMMVDLNTITCHWKNSDKAVGHGEVEEQGGGSLLPHPLPQ